MSDNSYFLADEQNNEVLRNTPLTPPVTVYAALLNSDPGKSSDFSSELPTIGGYARTPVSFGPSSLGISANNADCTFPQATTDWVPARFIAIVDSPTFQAGHVLRSAALPESVPVLRTQTLRFPAGAITWAN